MRINLSRLSVAVLFAGLTLNGTGCTDLTETPYTEITEANLKPTAADLPALMAAAYTPLQTSYMGWYGMVDFQEETADALLTPPRPNGWYDGGVYQRLHEHRWDAAQGQPGGQWNQRYTGISAANRVIDMLDAGLIDIDAATQAAVTAELRALRAFYYSLLIDDFGNVPIVLNSTSRELPEQSTRQQVFDFIVKELTESIPQLSTQTGTAMYGRMNQYAAKAVLSRVYLNAQVYTGTAQWDKVLQLTQEVISAAKYQLDPSYRTPFSRNNHTASKEIIFAVPYDAVNAPASNFHMKTLKPDLRFVFGMQAGPWGGSASNPQFIDTYDPDDGRLNDTWLMGKQRDAQGRGYDFVKHVPDMQRTEFYHGFPVKKYEIYSGMTGASDVDFPIIRYAEVLMQRAEALLRTGQAEAAAALVTQVRQRNFTGTAASKATVTGADLVKGSRYNYGWYDTDGVVKDGPGGQPVTNGGADIQFGRFLDELGWEFAVEAHRRQDLIRFGVFTKKMWFNHKPNGEFRTIFAIPQAVLSTNAKVEQNPGY